MPWYLQAQAVVVSIGVAVSCRANGVFWSEHYAQADVDSVIPVAWRLRAPLVQGSVGACWIAQDAAAGQLLRKSLSIPGVRW